MRLLIADTRLRANGADPEDLHRDEWIKTLRESDLGIDVRLVLPGHVKLQDTKVEKRSWDLKSGQALRHVQRDLPRIAGEWGADALLCLYSGAPFQSSVPVVSLIEYTGVTEQRNWQARLALAAARTGAQVSALRMTYDDLHGVGPSQALVPWVDPRFTPDPISADRETLQAIDLEAGYALAYGLDEGELPYHLAAWSWVVGSTGDSVPLIWVGLDRSTQDLVCEEARALDLTSSLRFVETPGLGDLAVLYRNASLFIGSQYPKSGQALRWALAAGRPVVAVETDANALILGKAAYLTPPGDARQFGAAMLSILVQEELSAALSDRAREQADRYRRQNPTQALVEAVKALSDPR